MNQTEQPSSKIWYVPVINCRDHLWVDITAINEGPARHYLCAACGAEKREPPACTFTDTTKP